MIVSKQSHQQGGISAERVALPSREPDGVGVDPSLQKDNSRERAEADTEATDKGLCGRLVCDEQDPADYVDSQTAEHEDSTLFVVIGCVAKSDGRYGTGEEYGNR